MRKGLLHNRAVVDRLRRLRPLYDRLFDPRPVVRAEDEPDAVLAELADRLIVLLSLGRSGTTVFCDFLASHPQVISLGEVLNEGTFHSFLKAPKAAARGRRASSARDQFYPWLRQQALRYPSGRIVLDMKFESLHLIEGNWHVPGYEYEFLDVLARSGVPVVLLERRDLVARFLSHEVARHRDRFHSFQKAGEVAAPVPIDMALMDRVIAANRAQIDRVRALFTGRSRFLDIAYEDMFEAGSDGKSRFRRALAVDLGNLMGLAPAFELKPRLESVGGGKTLDQVANRAEVEAYIAAHPVPSAPPMVAAETGDPDLSVLVVNWKTQSMTAECLASIEACPHACTLETILVDNGSGDGSAEALARQFPAVQVLAEPVNHGFAKANNIAAKRARGRYVLLLNSDTLVLPGALDAIMAFADAHPGAGIWGGRTVFGDGRLNPMSAWGKVSLWSSFSYATGLSWMLPGSGLFNPEGLGGWNCDSERAVDIVSGCFLLIERALWERLGGFDESFFMYGEDADLCARAIRLGYQPRVTPAATIVHHGGGSTPVPYMLARVSGAKAELARRSMGRVAAGLTRWNFIAAVALRRLVFETTALAFPRAREGRDRWREVWRLAREGGFFAARPKSAT